MAARYRKTSASLSAASSVRFVNVKRLSVRPHHGPRACSASTPSPPPFRSAATHKKCSFVVEQLLRAATAQQVVLFFAALEPYLDFCCANRYSSHVMETLLGLTHGLLAGERVLAADEPAADDADDADAPLPVPADALRSQLVSSVVAMAAALQVWLRTVLLFARVPITCLA